MNNQTAWMPPPADLILPDQEIHVWRAVLDQESQVIGDLESILSEEERARAHKFHFARDRHRFIVGRGLLRRVLAAYLRRQPEILQFRYGPRGKPSLHGRNEFPEINFNLAHSSGQVVYAFALRRRLGIDLELIRDDFPIIEIAKRFFSSQEIEDLLALPPSEQREAFFLGWTRKEAYVKARGEGLHIELGSFAVALGPGLEARFVRGVDVEWQLVSFSSHGVPGALVHDGTKCLVGYFNVPSSMSDSCSFKSQG